MTIGLIVLFGVDAALAAWAWALVRSGSGETMHGVGVFKAALICFGALLAHAMACVAFAFLVWHEQGLADRYMMAYPIISGLLPTLLFAYYFIIAASSSAVHALDGSAHGPKPEAFETARRLVKQGDIDGAVRDYRRVARAYPDTPDPLLAAAGVLEITQRFTEAAALLREVMMKFAGDDWAWVQAARRLETLCREEFDAPDETAGLHRAIESREAKLRRERGTAQGKAPRPRAGYMDAARRRVAGKDIPRAVALYRQQMAVRPDSPRPLFEAATALECDGQYAEAADTLREIIASFREDVSTRCEAEYRLANLLDNHFDDLATVKHLLLDIIKSVSGSKTAALAANRLTEINANSQKTALDNDAPPQ